MPKSREPTLPDGMSDLLESIHLQEQKESAATVTAEWLGRRLAPFLILQLIRDIDPDLLGTEEKELVMPKIREVARKKIIAWNLEDKYGDIPLPMRVQALSEETWLLMLTKRSKVEKEGQK